MAVKIKIGHASISELGSANGGTAGDQTKKEVYIDENYDVTKKSYNVLLRPKTSALAEASAAACEAGCKNDKIGYSQNNRNSLYSEAVKVGYDLSKITASCDTDCSAFMTVCAKAGGASFAYGYGGSSNAPTTRNMRNWFTKSGDYTELVSSVYLTSSDYLKRGDILVAEGSHTIMVLANGSKISANAVPAVLLKVAVTVVSISDTEAIIDACLFQSNAGSETLILDNTKTSSSNWSYSLTTTNGKPAEHALKSTEVKDGIVRFHLTKLDPATNYLIKVINTSKDKVLKVSSVNTRFCTIRTYPTAVKNLIMSADEASINKQKFTISFNSPDSWGNTKLKKCYRALLLINGASLAYNDELISVTDSKTTKQVTISDFINSYTFNKNDTIQIGIQPGLLDEKGKFTCDGSALRCSEPIILLPALKEVDKIYIGISNNFKQTILYGNLRGV